MNWKFWESEESILDEPTEKVLNELNTYSPNDPEWDANLTRMERLQALKSGEKARWIRRVSPDTVVSGCFTILSIVAIVAYEQKHVLTSKGMNYVKAPKAEHQSQK